MRVPWILDDLILLAVFGAACEELAPPDEAGPAPGASVEINTDSMSPVLNSAPQDKEQKSPSSCAVWVRSVARRRSS